MPKVFTSKPQKVGELGESVACIYLAKHGFTVFERNYTKKWGEIDIVARKGHILHFIEVKSVSRERRIKIDTNLYRPEDNMHPYKVRKLYRTIETYLKDRNVPENVEWQLDLICVYLDRERRTARVKMLNNIVG